MITELTWVQAGLLRHSHQDLKLFSTTSSSCNWLRGESVMIWLNQEELPQIITYHRMMKECPHHFRTGNLKEKIMKANNSFLQEPTPPRNHLQVLGSLLRSTTLEKYIKKVPSQRPRIPQLTAGEDSQLTKRTLIDSNQSLRYGNHKTWIWESYSCQESRLTTRGSKTRTKPWHKL